MILRLSAEQVEGGGETAMALRGLSTEELLQKLIKEGEFDISEEEAQKLRGKCDFFIRSMVTKSHIWLASK